MWKERGEEEKWGEGEELLKVPPILLFKFSFLYFVLEFTKFVDIPKRNEYKSGG